MNEKQVTIIRLVLILILSSLPSLANTSYEKVMYIPEPLTNLEIRWYETYERVVDSIKLHESYVSTPYFCPAGYLTVGYGHLIKETDQFTYPMSESVADSLLRADLDAAISFVKSTTDLKHEQLIAIGHFVFCLGSGNFYGSGLRKAILDKKPIDNELMKWIHIRTEQGKVANMFLRRVRRMELQLFKMKV